MKRLIKHRLSNAAKKPPALVFSIPLANSLDYAGSHACLTTDFALNQTPTPTEPSGATLGAPAVANSPGASNDIIVPVVVNKCASRLRDVGLDSEGIFRKPGAARRIAELQEVFDDPGREYGAGFSGSDWEPYTTEDVADLLRRYLTRLPEPVIPPSFYKKFVQVVPDEGPADKGSIVANASTPTQPSQASGAAEPRTPASPTSPTSPPTPKTPTTPTAPTAIAVTPEQAEAYAALIRSLPTANRHLLLYLLDLLAAFAAHAESTRMPASSLAAVFHPSVLALPDDGEGLDALKHKQGQDVLERMISLYGEIIQIMGLV
ncbi:rho gtpase activator [Ophiostoma piceae UAMH 11346]|uniref:Rho gtpase activator n=1 Tax=Ophiostoma piceae (strain UAMH 11346) TaxID=1262450 RepID=S3CFD2_OPHP1|nr:rho gtpase activator [Ophiostoma piceae UAMH 11346]